jgi:predicted Zn-dependent protease
MPEKSDRNALQRILIIAAGCAFLGTLVIPIAQMFTDASQPSSNVATTSESINEQAIRQQAKERAQAYEQVLKREPNNQAALQGLVDSRLKMNDLKGAIAPMEKLVKLYPNQKEYKALLEVIQQQASVQEKQK